MQTVAQVIRASDKNKKRRLACRWAAACLYRAQVSDLRSWKAYRTMLRYAENRATEAERAAAEVLAWEAHWASAEADPATYAVALLCGSDAEMAATEVADAACEIIGWVNVADMSW